MLGSVTNRLPGRLTVRLGASYLEHLLEEERKLVRGLSFIMPIIIVLPLMVIVALDKWRFCWVKVDSLNNNGNTLSSILLSKDSIHKVVTLSIHSAFGQTIQVTVDTYSVPNIIMNSWLSMYVRTYVDVYTTVTMCW